MVEIKNGDKICWNGVRIGVVQAGVLVWEKNCPPAGRDEFFRWIPHAPSETLSDCFLRWRDLWI